MAGPSSDNTAPDEPPPAYNDDDNKFWGSQSSSPSPSLLLPLPQYSCDLALESVFCMKMEIEDTVKRAEDRHWHSVFVHLRGPALHVYRVRRDWGWGRTCRAGPDVSPDNPPWLKRAKLEKTYTLLHADVGIAADYPKRRYVIRVRAETDQFLLSCIELPNFIRWLDALFAAINVAPVIEEREFPKDQSLPRGTRLAFSGGRGIAEGSEVTNRGGTTRPAPVIHHSAMTPRYPRPRPPSQPEPDSYQLTDDPLPLSHTHVHQQTRLHPSLLSSSASPFSAATTASVSSDDGGKWRPRHEWTTTHDMVYAKQCYSLLLFRSPRKSNYIVVQGKKWLVSDWTTGRMVRVLPPGYFDETTTGVDVAGGPFRVWAAENRII
ncbi:hypothetical protein PG989_002867 [Apiospora arundinis]